MDEILDYIIMLSVSVAIKQHEGYWREFPTHKRDPPVQQLTIHLENGQRVYFTEDTGVGTSFWRSSKDHTNSYLHCVGLTTFIVHVLAIYLEQQF